MATTPIAPTPPQIAIIIAPNPTNPSATNTTPIASPAGSGAGSVASSGQGFPTGN